MADISTGQVGECNRQVARQLKMDLVFEEDGSLERDIHRVGEERGGQSSYIEDLKSST